MPNVSEITENDLNHLISLIEPIKQIYSSEANVHDLAKKTGNIFKDVFELDRSYSISNTALNFNETYKEIIELVNQSDLDQSIVTNVLKALNVIKSDSRQIEPETGLDVKNLLIRTWSLIKHPNMSKQCCVIIDSLAHNHLNGGGCLAGIAVRLVNPYCSIVL